MAMAVTYAVQDGMILWETRSGVTTVYVPDHNGNVIECRDNSGNQTYSAEYWPYGEVQTSTGTNPGKFGFGEIVGYVTDSVSRLYVRARHYAPARGSWLTVDPLWPEYQSYAYTMNSPSFLSDPFGLAPRTCIGNLSEGLTGSISRKDGIRILKCGGECGRKGGKGSTIVNCIVKCATDLGLEKVKPLLEEYVCCYTNSVRSRGVDWDPTDASSPGFDAQGKCCDYRFCLALIRQEYRKGKKTGIPQLDIKRGDAAYVDCAFIATGDAAPSCDCSSYSGPAIP